MTDVTEKLLDVGIALSAEKDANRLLEIILDAAMDISRCDGGTLYILRDEKLHFKLLKTKSRGFRRGFDGEAVDLPPVPLAGSNDCARAALTRRPVNVADVYACEGDKYSGTLRYDAMTGYKTVSMLSVPMEDDRQNVIGVLQLINAQDCDGSVAAFAPECERVIYSLASQAAICLVNRNYALEITELLDSFVRAMAAAIDARSPYNANHTRNMARMAERFTAYLAENGISPGDGGPEPGRGLLMSVWLHDIGKLAVPAEVMDKQSRLGAMMPALRQRFAAYRMRAEIDLLRGDITPGEHERRAEEIGRIEALVSEADAAGYLTDETLAAVREAAETLAAGPDGPEPYLTAEEAACLAVRRGTLTDTERRLMESHVQITERILSQMSFPAQYRDVPGWASGHHELLNGKGYPRGLAGEDIPVPVRILTILDIYDALTANDRPYKPPMPPEKAFAILEDMARGGQLDTRLLALFAESGAWRGQ
ncbi:MAG: GAF domain-containing protein [Oscillospiraceae bacterium]|jgi:HD-GYP domain-containing protein (c-di-GMP phosphodiesterase class II)|nr:GAF domain-containing protein [Oscillospiraceae bacterium]